MKNKRKFKILKICLFTLIICIFIALTVYFFPFFKNLSTLEGQLEFKEKINSMGILGPVAIICIVVLQILVPFLPGEPIEILAGMCFGTFTGTLIIFIGTFLSSAIIFFSIRKFGTKFINSFSDSKKLNKLKNSAFFSNPRKITIFLFIMFLIPGTPKDLFVYLGGILNVRPMIFLLISTFGRFPSIISSTFAGSRFVSGDFKLSIIVFAITFVISIFGFYLASVISKKHSNKKIAKI